MTELDLHHLRNWIGREEHRVDTLNAGTVAAFFAAIDRAEAPPRPGEPLPALAHWLFFKVLARPGDLSPDGHPRRDDFLPPVPSARRMWAGARLQFVTDLRIGDDIRCRSRIDDVRIKEGRSGALVFVSVRHEISSIRGLALTDENDIVFRLASVPGASPSVAAPLPAPGNEAFSRVIVPDPVLLFRYSALTFNSHRIHYDRSYATGVEGYPGLVVHGPLIAILLLDLLHREFPAARVRRFDFKAVRPLFDIHPFEVCGRPQPGLKGERFIELWARDHEGFLAMQAQAELI